MKLNLGCGPDRRAGYWNVDIRSEVEPDIVADVRRLPTALSGVSEILAQDILEHLPIDEIRPTLADWRWRLKDGGLLVLRVPDLEACVRWLDAKPMLIYNIFGGQDYPENTHLSGFTAARLERILIDAGFAIRMIESDRADHNLYAEAVRQRTGR